MQGNGIPHTHFPVPMRVWETELRKLAEIGGLSSQVLWPFLPPAPPTLVIKPWVNWVIQTVMLRRTNWKEPGPHRLPHDTLPILPSATEPPNVSLDRWSTPLLIPACSRPPFFDDRAHRVHVREHRGLVLFHILNAHLLNRGQINQD